MNLPIIKLCFLSEERFFNLIVDFNKTIPAAFITCFVTHPKKQNYKTTAKLQCAVLRNIANFLGHPVVQ